MFGGSSKMYLPPRKVYCELFKALVITPNEKTVEVGSLLAIARSEARRREHVGVNPPVRALVFVAELGVYVAVYEVVETQAKGNQEKG
jgi:hypothetical protein